MGAAVSVSGVDGAPVDLAGANPAFTVESSRDGGPWRPVLGVRHDFHGPHRLDVVLVADNSGSQVAVVDTMREALSDFAQRLLQRAATDRVGLVRVSTVASVVQPLTEEQAHFDEAVGRLFVTNGWSALWDGVRLANEVLADAPPALDASSSVAGFCADRTHRAIVAFTDGRENNSSDEHETRYPGDGIDTTFDDLTRLRVAGVKTPVHWVGIGPKADAPMLAEMAIATGARYVAVDNLSRLHGALTSTAARLTAQVPICFELTECGRSDLRLTVEFDLDGERQSLTYSNWATAHCTCEKKMRCTLED